MGDRATNILEEGSSGTSSHSPAIMPKRAGQLTHCTIFTFDLQHCYPKAPCIRTAKRYAHMNGSSMEVYKCCSHPANASEATPVSSISVLATLTNGMLTSGSNFRMGFPISILL